ncbi:alanine racemase [Mycobacterium terramassiliense]|uniref:alanine racemase n=1 Tax=Mycobacterium terramassiliense TaxID=1841859 RepID=UPI0009FA6046|nr:alanine racemase [Mycobacterium terramassiliense]
MTIRPADALAQAMIGEPNSRFRLPTPALILDEAALDANISRMAERTRGRVALRPHAKTHKCAWIARKQIAAGAVGICCAKIGEAEALSAAGVRGILLTSPVADPLMPKRLCDVAALDPGFACVVDHPDPVIVLNLEACRRGIRVNVLIDVDVGLGRTGVFRSTTRGRAGRARPSVRRADVGRRPGLRRSLAAHRRPPKALRRSQ